MEVKEKFRQIAVEYADSEEDRAALACADNQNE
jgi:hypothetical protein